MNVKVDEIKAERQTNRKDKIDMPLVIRCGKLKWLINFYSEKRGISRKMNSTPHACNAWCNVYRQFFGIYRHPLKHNDRYEGPSKSFAMISFRYTKRGMLHYFCVYIFFVPLFYHTSTCDITKATNKYNIVIGILSKLSHAHLPYLRIKWKKALE